MEKNSSTPDDYKLQKEGQSSELKRRLLSGGYWAFAGKVVTAIAALVVNALLARLLTPEEMGAYFLTFSLVSVAAVMAQLGLNQTVVRLVAESLGTGKPGRARAAIRTVFRYGTIGALVVAGLLAFGVGQWLAHHTFNSPLMASVMGLASAWVVVITFQRLLAETFRGFHDIRLASIFEGLVTCVFSALLFAFLWVMQGHSNLAQVLVLTVAAGITSALVAGFLLRQKVSDLEGDGDLQAREVLNIAWPLLITNLTLFALTQADIWILGMFRPQEEVAIYGAAARLVTLLVMPLMIVNAVVPPLIAEMYARGEKKSLEHILRLSATLAGIPTFIILLGFILFSNKLLAVVFGGYYSKGALVLILLSMGRFVNVGTGSCGLTLMMTGHQAVMMTITITCGILNIVLCLWVVTSYGPIGIAVVSAFGMTLQNIAMWLGAKLTTGMWTHVGITTLLNSQGIINIRQCFTESN